MKHKANMMLDALMRQMHPAPTMIGEVYAPGEHKSGAGLYLVRGKVDGKPVIRVALKNRAGERTFPRPFKLDSTLDHLRATMLSERLIPTALRVTWYF